MKTKYVQLKQWLFTKPVMFALTFICSFLVLGLIWSCFDMLFFTPTLLSTSAILVLSCIISAWYMIKKLPHSEMHQHDFIAISNGVYLISILFTLIAVFTGTFYGRIIQQKMMLVYMTAPSMFTVIGMVFVFISLYLTGVMIAGIYAKYKRATTIGISPWKVILSMPFSFLLIWTPGYLIEEKKQSSNLEIKSKWYIRFNNWVISDFSNILFVFLFFVLFRSFIGGLSMIILTVAMLILYALWYTKHKKDFIKNINRSYALSCVLINLAILIPLFIKLITM